jgi:hypothetical protein
VDSRPAMQPAELRNPPYAAERKAFIRQRMFLAEISGARAAPAGVIYHGASGLTAHLQLVAEKRRWTRPYRFGRPPTKVKTPSRFGQTRVSG